MGELEHLNESYHSNHPGYPGDQGGHDQDHVGVDRSGDGGRVLIINSSIDSRKTAYRALHGPAFLNVRHTFIRRKRKARPQLGAGRSLHLMRL